MPIYCSILTVTVHNTPGPVSVKETGQSLSEQRLHFRIGSCCSNPLPWRRLQQLATDQPHFSRIPTRSGMHYLFLFTLGFPGQLYFYLHPKDNFMTHTLLIVTDPSDFSHTLYLIRGVVPAIVKWTGNTVWRHNHCYQVVASP